MDISPGFTNRDYFQAVALGQEAGHSRVTATGQNDDIDASTVPEDIWSAWWTITWLAAPATLEVLSDNANDTAAGTGTRTVTITWLNSLYNVITETVTLNGLTPVTTTQQFFRVNSFVQITAWTNWVNVGWITLRVSWGWATMAFIQPWIGRARTTWFTVPAWFTLCIISLFAGINRSASSQFASVATFFRNSVTGAYTLPLELGIYNENPHIQLSNYPIIVPEKFDFSLRVLTTSANNINITGGWLWDLKNNLSA